jgi:prepilin-type N-terminal cleavage/methylation domain-containing protein
MKKNINGNKGFTLIEILLVVAAIGILAGIVILAINPNKQLGETRNAQRKADVNTILNAVYQYIIDSNGVIPAAITTTPTAICKSGVLQATCTTNSLVYLAGDLTTNEKYLTAIPFDPTTSTANSTNYLISKSANGRITVSAPGAEQSATISVTR